MAETYGELYAAADAMGRREILRNGGIRLTIHADGEPTLRGNVAMRAVIGLEEVPVSILGEFHGVVRSSGQAVARGDLDLL